MAWPSQNTMGASGGKTPFYSQKGSGVGNSKPGSVSPATNKGSTSVRSYDASSVSAGKNPSSMGGVTLGTTRNNHNVAHRISGSQNHGPGQNPRGDTAG